VNTNENKIINDELNKVRALDYEVLKKYVLDKRVDSYQIKSNDLIFEVEILYFWDSEINGNIRVIGSVNKVGSFPTFFKPTSSDFILSPKGVFIGTTTDSDVPNTIGRISYM
jgi:hypothetical protein